jgi:chromosome segregation protein
LYLKSLTLKGFKSFATSTTFAFEQGVTCVVGPNGSGKSNVVDALAWVMGEQGAKTLRGGKMEDVIFAGTATRGPLGRAEVLLTIDNSDGALPIDYSEVTISRTLFRNGGSEYAINGENCRLLDVQELLSDSGLGREMHVIVGQGQLDAVLHASADERRGFIEEAAGILKHRRRKEKTLRKLDAMQANLTRLSDLAGEIRRQLKPLGQQAEIAREAQLIAAIVRDARARLLADDVAQLREALTRFSRTENERKSERIVLQEQLDQARLRVARIEQSMVGDAVDRARQTAFALEQVQDHLRGLYTLANQKLALLGSASEAASTATTISDSMVAEVRAEADRLRGDVTTAEVAVGAAAGATATAKASLDSLDEEISAQSALVSRHDLEVARLASQIDVAKSRLAATQGELVRQQAALADVEQRREATRAEFVALEAEAAISDSGDGQLDTRYEEAEALVRGVQSEIETMRDDLHTLERERDALAARTSALSMAVDQKDGSASIVGSSGIRGLVAEHVRVTPGYEAAIAAALGTLADAVLADDLDSALSALGRARASDAGRVEIVVAEAPEATQLGGLPDGVLPASSFVAAPAGVLGILSRVVIVESLESARAAWPSLRAIGGLTAITRAGDVLTDYVLRGGTGAKRSRLELVAERDAAAERLGVVSTSIERARFALAERRGALEVAQAEAATALASLREFDAALAAHSERLGRLRVQLEASQAEWERLSSAVQRAAETARAAGEDVERATAERDEYSATPRPMLDVSSREGMVAELEAARAAELELRIQLETARERVRQEDARAQNLARQLVAERAAADEQARRTVIRQRQVASATGVVELLPAVLDAVDRSVSEARLALAAREAERASQNEELVALRISENSLRERLDSVGDDVHGLEMQLYEKKLQLSTLLERAGEELGLVEDVLIAEYGPDVLVPSDDELTHTPVPGAASDPRGDGERAGRSGNSRRPRASAVRARRAGIAPGCCGPQARSTGSGQPARPRGVRRARAAAQVPGGAAHGPHQYPSRPADDHR